mgnify:FL=1
MLGRGKDIRQIDIADSYEAIGPEIATAIIGFHSFTGCDFTSKFNGKSKKSSWKLLLKSDGEILKAFHNLSNPNTDLDSYLIGLEKFVINLYEKNDTQFLSSLGSLRWSLFSKYQYESAKLPPTTSALEKKILRSRFVSNMWSQAHLPIMKLLDLEACGWKKRDDGSLQAITTDLPPAPVAIVETSLCRCKTS